jgi:DNA-binding response OmpR family regulator
VEQRSVHPLLPRVDVLITRRPRFTASQAIILNTLVNSQGPVDIKRLVRLVDQFLNREYQTTEQSIHSQIYQIRAKLGEESHHPTQIITTAVQLRSGEWVTAFKYVDLQ